MTDLVSCPPQPLMRKRGLATAEQFFGCASSAVLLWVSQLNHHSMILHPIGMATMYVPTCIVIIDCITLQLKSHYCADLAHQEIAQQSPDPWIGGWE